VSALIIARENIYYNGATKCRPLIIVHYLILFDLNMFLVLLRTSEFLF